MRQPCFFCLTCTTPNGSHPSPPARGGRGKKEGLLSPRSLATTRPLGARRPGREGLGADVSIECRSARRYVLTSRGLVNKRPGRSHGLTQFERALMKVNPVALCVTGTDVLCGWIARRSRRKLWGTRQQQPGLLARALPLQGRCHRFESGWAHFAHGLRWVPTPGSFSPRRRLSCPTVLAPWMRCRHPSA